MGMVAKGTPPYPLKIVLGAIGRVKARIPALTLLVYVRRRIVYMPRYGYANMVGKEVWQMTDREMKEKQEDRLYENLLASRLIKEGKTAKLQEYLGMMGVKAQNGMTADEIDAVSDRVNRAIALMSE